MRLRMTGSVSGSRSVCAETTPQSAARRRAERRVFFMTVLYHCVNVQINTCVSAGLNDTAKIRKYFVLWEVMLHGCGEIVL